MIFILTASLQQGELSAKLCMRTLLDFSTELLRFWYLIFTLFTSESSNAFVEKCLSMVISYTKESLGISALSEIIAFVSTKGKVVV